LSLLLDALKRAEQEKLARQGGAPADVAKEPQRPVPVAVPPAPRPASLELQPLAGAAEAHAPQGAAPRSADASAAQNVFQAKEQKAAPAGGSRAALFWIVGIVVAMLLLGGGGYVWYSINSFTPRTVASARPRPVPITPAPTAAPAGPSAPGAPAAFVPAQPGEAPQAAQPAAPAAPQGATTPPASSDRPAPPAQKQDAVREAVAALLRENAPAAPDVRFAATPREPVRVAPAVAEGYKALAAGDDAAARKAYGAALAIDATNLDALLGMATVEARAGNRLLAASYYGKALDVDPRDATARAGLAALATREQPEGLESQLRSDLARSPASPQLHFALGNLLASQNRWNEAQVEFFDAYRLDPANADLAYNLAVSLDHLRQDKLAAEYYDRALKGARASGAQFDAAQAARRLAQLRG